MQWHILSLDSNVAGLTSIANGVISRPVNCNCCYLGRQMFRYCLPHLGDVLLSKRWSLWLNSNSARDKLWQLMAITVNCNLAFCLYCQNIYATWPWLLNWHQVLLKCPWAPSWHKIRLKMDRHLSWVFLPSEWTLAFNWLYHLLLKCPWAFN